MVVNLAPQDYKKMLFAFFDAHSIDFTEEEFDSFCKKNNLEFRLDYMRGLVEKYKQRYQRKLYMPEKYLEEASQAKDFEELEEIYEDFCFFNTDEKVIRAFYKNMYAIGVPSLVLRNIPTAYAIENDTIYTFNGSGIWENGEHRIHAFLETQNEKPAAKLKFTSAQKMETITQLKHRTYRNITDFDNCPPYILPVQNGVLDLRTLTLRDYTPEDMFTKKLAVAYQANARCDRFLQFLEEVSPTEEGKKEKMIKGLKQLIGYCLYKRYPIQKVFMLIGGGSNGKGVLLTTLHALFGVENVSSVSVPSLSNDKFCAAEMYNMYVNLSSELTSGELKNTDLIKSLCGGDLLMAQRKFMQPFKFVNGAKLIVASNQPPQVSDASVGWFRRVHMFRFTKEFGEGSADKTLTLKLTSPESLSGILNVGIAELKEWLNEDGSFKPTADFCNSEKPEDIRKVYEKLSDPVASFVYEACTGSMDSDAYVTKEAVYDAYCKYVLDRNLQKLSNYVFNRRFKDVAKFVSEFRPSHMTESGARARCWYGLKLIEPEE